ncbi:MAG: three-Cys-motif partner protein TcmP [Dehalococcoidia bacterium]|nr:three-Cys-motif partner protein TcmP [Dehalococcoidia bacterium]
MAARKIPDEDLLDELTATPDGGPVRQIKPHTLKKLAVLLLYFKPFTQIVKGGYYVDGMAGPGICEVKDVPQTRFVWGSPLLALRTQPGFERCWFVELDKKNKEALETRTSAIPRRSEVQLGDVNVLVPRIVGEVRRTAPCFCFLDPEATEVHWSTVDQVAHSPRRNKRPEILINFPLEMAFQRLLTRDRPMDAASVEKADRFFPTSEWKDVYQAYGDGVITASEANEQYLSLYKKGFEGLGYKPDRIQSLLVKTPGQLGGKGHPLYHLIFASDSDTGSRIMKYVLERQNWLDHIIMGRLPLFREE